MLSNAYFLAKFRFDTAENEPAKNLQNFRKMHFSKMHGELPGLLLRGDERLEVVAHGADLLRERRRARLERLLRLPRALEAAALHLRGVRTLRKQDVVRSLHMFLNFLARSRL